MLDGRLIARHQHLRCFLRSSHFNGHLCVHSSNLICRLLLRRGHRAVDLAAHTSHALLRPGEFITYRVGLLRLKPKPSQACDKRRSQQDLAEDPIPILCD